MSQFEQIPALPNDAAYQRGLTHLFGEHSLSNLPMLDKVITERELRDYEFRAYMGRLATISYQIEQSTDQRIPGDTSFMSGAAFATFLAEYVHQGAISYHDIHKALPQAGVTDSKTRKQTRIDAALPFIRDGIFGSSHFIDKRMGILLTPLETTIVDNDAVKRELFRMGLGLILLSADTAHRAKLNEAPLTLDWDQLLRESPDSIN